MPERHFTDAKGIVTIGTFGNLGYKISPSRISSMDFEQSLVAEFCPQRSSLILFHQTIFNPERKQHITCFNTSRFILLPVCVVSKLGRVSTNNNVLFFFSKKWT